MCVSCFYICGRSRTSLTNNLEVWYSILVMPSDCRSGTPTEEILLLVLVFIIRELALAHSVEHGDVDCVMLCWPEAVWCQGVTHGVLSLFGRIKEQYMDMSLESSWCRIWCWWLYSIMLIGGCMGWRLVMCGCVWPPVTSALPPYWPIEASVRYANPLNWHVGPWNFPARPSPEG